ncbi:hypothetical protein IQ07DRAFT_676616 [Pyrenochaeta sp. DS3sAY3a]|nr:hypothetical protein IQ07DRAFT_676616 [Pyrenochaeta sp. DS3sAY3a]
MSFSTQPAFIHTGTWDDTTRAHPCMKWMEHYTRAIDAKAWDTQPSTPYLTASHTLHKSNGTTVSGGPASFASLSTEIYAPFAAHLHDPELLLCWESGDGWEMLGVATLYWDLAVPAGGEGKKEKVRDREGREWDGKGPAAFAFAYERQGDGGIRLSKTAIYADPTAAVVEMMKRGMMKAEDLVK